MNVIYLTSLYNIINNLFDTPYTQYSNDMCRQFLVIFIFWYAIYCKRLLVWVIKTFPNYKSSIYMVYNKIDIKTIL